MIFEKIYGLKLSVRTNIYIRYIRQNSFIISGNGILLFHKRVNYVTNEVLPSKHEYIIYIRLGIQLIVILVQYIVQGILRDDVFFPTYSIVV